MSTPALPQAGHSTSDDHMAISRRFAAHAMDELSRGNRRQASEKVWGAAAHALKAVGIQRGWHHRTHLIVKDIGFHLARELGRPDLRNHVIKADSMHQNFYENEADDDIILDAIIDVGEFVDKLAEVSASPPRPFTVETGADQRRLGRFLGLPAEELPELGTRSPTGFSRAAPANTRSLSKPLGAQAVLIPITPKGQADDLPLLFAGHHLPGLGYSPSPTLDIR